MPKVHATRTSDRREWGNADDRARASEIGGRTAEGGTARNRGVELQGADDAHPGRPCVRDVVSPPSTRRTSYARGCQGCPGRPAKVFEVKQLVDAGFDGDNKLWYTDSEQVIP